MGKVEETIFELGGEYLEHREQCWTVYDLTLCRYLLCFALNAPWVALGQTCMGNMTF